MKHQLAAIGLAPLWIPQALYVRSITPRLPEPQGERFGTHGSGPAIRLLILGDSAAAGVGVATQSQALSGQLVSALGSDFQVSWKLIAKTGHKAKDVLTTLETLVPEPYDFVVTSIGVNDVTHGTGTRKWTDQQTQIVERLQSRFQSRCIILSGVPPMHLFPALPQPLRWYLGARARRLNRALSNIADGCKQCVFVSIDFPLEAAYMAADGFHPGAPAYALWAGHIAGIIRSRIDHLCANCRGRI